MKLRTRSHQALISIGLQVGTQCYWDHTRQYWFAASGQVRTDTCIVYNLGPKTTTRNTWLSLARIVYLRLLTIYLLRALVWSVVETQVAQ